MHRWREIEKSRRDCARRRQTGMHRFGSAAGFGCGKTDCRSQGRVSRHTRPVGARNGARAPRDPQRQGARSCATGVARLSKAGEHEISGKHQTRTIEPEKRLSNVPRRSRGSAWLSNVPRRSRGSAPLPASFAVRAGARLPQVISRLPVLDRLNRRSAITRRPFVTSKREFHPAAAEQMPRLKCVTKAEPAPGNPDSSGRPIAA